MVWTLVHGSPLLFGILIGRVFDRLAARSAGGGDRLGPGGRVCDPGHRPQPGDLGR